MKTSKFTATFIGLITAVICLGLSFTIALPIVFLLPTALPLEYISGWIVGESNYPAKLITILSIESAFLLVACGWYFKKLISDKKQLVKFSGKRLILFFVVLQFIVHPMGFYCWLIQGGGDPDDGMIIFYIVETVSYSGSFFIVLGILIDLLRNRNMKKAGSTDAVRLS